MTAKHIVTNLREHEGHTHPTEGCTVCRLNVLKLQRYSLLVRRSKRALIKLAGERRMFLTELAQLNEALTDINEAVEIGTLSAEIENLDLKGVPPAPPSPPKKQVTVSDLLVPQYEELPPVRDPLKVRLLLARALQAMAGEPSGK